MTLPTYMTLCLLAVMAGSIAGLLLWAGGEWVVRRVRRRYAR